jgi:WD40 repeat protein
MLKHEINRLIDPSRPSLGILLLSGIIGLVGCSPGSSSDSQNSQRQLSGHNGWVTTVAWSPDSKFLISGSLDTTARVWNAATGEEVETLTGFHGSVEHVAWSTDGKYVTTVSAEPTNNVRVWDPVTWTPVQMWTISEDVGDLAWSPDNTRFALDLSNGDFGDAFRSWIQVYKAGNWTSNTILTSTFGISDLTWSPDGRKLAFYEAREGINSNLVEMEFLTGANADAEAEPRTLVELPDVVTALDWSPDGRYLASARFPQDVEIWDAITGENVATFSEHTATIENLAWSPTGELLASASYDFKTIVWSLASKTSIRTLEHPDAVWDVAWSPDDKYLATACADRNIYIWQWDK